MQNRCYMCIQWTRVLCSVVITRQSNPPVSQFNSTLMLSMLNGVFTCRTCHCCLLVLLLLLLSMFCCCMLFVFFPKRYILSLIRQPSPLKEFLLLSSPFQWVWFDHYICSNIMWPNTLIDFSKYKREWFVFVYFYFRNNISLTLNILHYGFTTRNTEVTHTTDNKSKNSK